MFNRFLGGLGKFLISLGVIILMFAGYQLWGTSIAEAADQNELANEFATDLDLAGETETEATEDVTNTLIDALENIQPERTTSFDIPDIGDAAGLIEIPKINLRPKSFVEGVAKKDLRRGPGHYPTTPFPGQPGNASIAGHRSTYGAPFNRIDELAAGDEILVYTGQGKFTYEVLPPPQGIGIAQGPGWYTVSPSQNSVLNNTDDDRLTLTACHPKYSARERIIVHAKLVSSIAPDTSSTAPTVTTPVEIPDEPDPSQTVVTSPEEVDASEIDLIAGDASELRPSLLFALMFGGVWLISIAIVSFLRTRSRHAWLAYSVFLIPAGILLWNCFLHLDRYLPSY